MELDFSSARMLPMPHQAEDTAAVVQHPFYFITSQMRTGKSKIVIDGAQFLYRLGIIDRVIVLAPDPVIDVWFDPEMGQLQEHLWENMQAKITRFHARSWSWRWPHDEAEPELQWFITNYEFIRRKQRMLEFLPYCTPRTLIVMDESSAVKTYDSDTTKMCSILRYHCGRVILLNGTPISHSPMDLFAQGNMLHPSILECKYITHFRARYCIMGGYEVRGRPTQIQGWRDLDDLQRRFAPYTVRRLQSDVLKHLPKKMKPVNLTAALTNTTWGIYKEMRDDAVVYLQGQDVATLAPQAVTKILRLAQITSGFLGGVEDISVEEVKEPLLAVEPDATPALENEHGLPAGWLIADTAPRPNLAAVVGTPAAGFDGVVEIGREKLDVLLWLLEQKLNEEDMLKIVVWCRFKPEHARMMREVTAFYAKHPRYRTNIAAIVGGQKKSDRLAAMKLMHPDTAPPEGVFIGGTFGTGSKGTNMTAAHTSVNCSYDHSLEKYLQSGDRVYGPGQVTDVGYYNIIATGPKGQKTIDHIIVKARDEAEDLANWTTSAWIKALKVE